MTTHERFWERPQAPKHPLIEPWEELPDDPNYPTFENADRLGVERHWHTLAVAKTDEWADVSATAVFVTDGLTGCRIEFGPWTLEPREARVLARSLLALADALEPEHQTA
ncbi:hypothetical protein [Rhodococcus pyridinivorans]|uniref:Uncharacterized protein n=1 Tax=Rhodococcus pyridinivorans TaxID=103816 RepID=A0A7M2XII8_9NOCA|nr:hypothetical protein [Rhodococcus pyridinivorans]QOV97233.1 hypothetical protein INP59_14785 [Rhodococcus pyridinivorans]